MISEVNPDLERSISRRFWTLADDDRVKRATAALEANWISVLRAAKRTILSLIPDGSQLHHGASQTLAVTGITDELEKSGRAQPNQMRSS